MNRPCPKCGHVEPHRSLSQNNLQYKWFSVISKHTGDTPDMVRAQCKLRYGIPLICAEDAKFAERWQYMTKTMTYGEKLTAALMLPLTQNISREQMCEYLTTIDQVYGEMGINLPNRETLFAESMGY